MQRTEVVPMQVTTAELKPGAAEVEDIAPSLEFRVHYVQVVSHRCS